MKICFMGTPEFAVPILKRLNDKYEICLVVSQPNRAKKKNNVIPTPVALCANELGLKLFQPEKIKDDYEELVNCGADVMVTAAYGQYVPTKVLKLFKKCINVHGSLLPKYRGGAPIQRSIINGEKTTGVTIMEMVKKLDAGRMYAKREVEINEEDTNSLLFEKLSLIGADLLMDSIEDIVNGINEGIEQIEEESTYAKNLEPCEEIIDFNKSSFLVARHINGMANEPGAYFTFNDVKVKVFGAKAVECDIKAVPGTVLSLKKQVLVKTLNGAVLLTKLLLPGKKMMLARDFVNGQRLLKENDVIS